MKKLIILLLCTSGISQAMKNASMPNLPMTQHQTDKHADFLNALERNDLFYITRSLQNKEIDLNTCLQNQDRTGSGSICYARKSSVPLLFALEKSNPVVITLLLSHGAQVNKPDERPPLSQAIEIVLEKAISKERLSSQALEELMQVPDILLAFGADIGQGSLPSKRTVFHKIASYMCPHETNTPEFANTWKVYFRLLMSLLQKEVSEQSIIFKKGSKEKKSPLVSLLDKLEPIFKQKDSDGKTVYDISCADCAPEAHGAKCKNNLFDRAYIESVFGRDAWREYNMMGRQSGMRTLRALGTQ